jgi:TonB family protein
VTKAKLLKSVLMFVLLTHAAFAFAHDTRAALTPPQSSAQAGIQTAAQSPSPQSTAAEEKWERYTFEGEEFSVELPAMPFDFESWWSVGLRDRESMRDFGVYSGGVVYAITSYDNARSGDSLDRFASYSWSAGLKRVRDLKLGGFDGREYEFREGLLLRARVFRTKRHAYLIRAMTDGTDDPRVARFLDSFTLGNAPSGRPIRETPTPTHAPDEVYKPSEVVRKAVIVFKPEPWYTEEARNNNVRGTIRLRAVLAGDGRVKDISVVKSLPYGMTDVAVNAARHILFFPAEKGGQKVSQYATLEYNFNIY